MKSGRVRLVVLIGVIALGVLFRSSLSAHAKSLLLISDTFPQIPVKPLQVIAPPPAHERVALSSPLGTVTADIVMPVPRFGEMAPRSTPALILAMGVKTQESDRANLLNLATTLSRLGYVVIWPRLAVLDQGAPLVEDPSTFLLAYHHAEQIPAVDPGRISFVGFSVGAALALVTAADRDISDRVRSLVFFGGYYDIFEYLAAVATQTSDCGGEIVAWRADPDAINQLTGILREKRSPEVLRLLDAATRQEADEIRANVPPGEADELRRLSPRERLEGFKARIFILHDRADHYVPYCESVRLNQALGSRGQHVFLLVAIFEHVLPTGNMSPDVLVDFARLYWFLATALEWV